MIQSTGMSCDSRITLRSARIALGYSAEYVANILNLPLRTFIKYESNPANLEIATAARILQLYELPFHQVSFRQWGCHEKAKAAELRLR